MTFSMILSRRPVASGSGGEKNFRAALQQSARTILVNQELLSGMLYIRVIWFYKIETRQDIDNILKPIFDALKGIVYLDDLSITTCLAMKIDISSSAYRIFSENIRLDDHITLLSVINVEPHVLYLEVGAFTESQVRFGPIEGE